MACSADCPPVADPGGFVAAPLAQYMERVEELSRDPAGHWWRNLLACRACGQLYFQEFYEEIDWVSGADPQWVMFIPVDDRTDALRFNAMVPGEVITDRRRLTKNWPSDAQRALVRWLT